MPRPIFKKVRDALVARELAHTGVISRMLGGRGRHGVIEGDRQPFGMLDAFVGQLLEDRGDSGGIVMTQNDIRFDDDDIAGIDLVTAGWRAPTASPSRFAAAIVNHFLNTVEPIVCYNRGLATSTDQAGEALCCRGICATNSITTLRSIYSTAVCLALAFRAWHPMLP